MPAPGWYNDPAGQPATERYWDGSTWSEQTRPVAEPTPPPATPQSHGPAPVRQDPFQVSTPAPDPSPYPQAGPSDQFGGSAAPGVSPYPQGPVDPFAGGPQPVDPFGPPSGYSTQADQHYGGGTQDPYGYQDPTGGQFAHPDTGPGGGDPFAGRREAQVSKLPAGLSGLSDRLPFRFERRTVIALAVALAVIVAVIVLRGGSDGSTAEIEDAISAELETRDSPGTVDCPAELPDTEGASMECTVTYDADQPTQKVIVTRRAEGRYSWEFGLVDLPADPPAEAPTSTEAPPGP